MTPITLREYEQVPLEALGENAGLLRELDESWAAGPGDTVLDWSRRDFVKAKSHVGVLQVGGLLLEILPKTDEGNDLQSVPTARSNLLFMLSRAGTVPVQERDLASLATERLHLLDALVLLFARHLLDELRRGLHRAYRPEEENLTAVRGRILMTRHIQLNAWRRDRLYVAYDEFDEDNRIGQTLKAACRALLQRAVHPLAARVLTECLSVLVDVRDSPVSELVARPIVFDRQNRRYQFLTEFAQTVLRQQSPNLSAGRLRSFSLLVPMEKLFEQFIASTCRQHMSALGLSGWHLRIQAEGDRRPLLTRQDPCFGRPAFFLNPDLLVQERPRQRGGAEVPTRLVLDTKWKRIDAPGSADVSSDDVYQLTAYALRYRCLDNVLLYPAVRASDQRQHYRINMTGVQPTLRFEFIDLKRNLLERHSEFLADLKGILGLNGALERQVG